METNYFTIWYWFCHTSTWIFHGYTRVPHPEPISLPLPSLWVFPVHQPQTSCIMHRTWTGDSFHIWYYTCFNAILPNHPTLSLSHRVQQTVLYICVSFAMWLYFCFANEFICTIFLDFTYKQYHMMFVFLTSLNMTISRSIHCWEPAWGTPPMAKVMRRKLGIRKGVIKPQETPCSRASTPKPEYFTGSSPS